MASDSQISEAKTQAQLSVSKVVLAHCNNPVLGVLSHEDVQHLMDKEFTRWLEVIVQRDQPAVQGFPWGPVLAVGGSILFLALMAWISYIPH